MTHLICLGLALNFSVNSATSSRILTRLAKSIAVRSKTRSATHPWASTVVAAATFTPEEEARCEALSAVHATRERRRILHNRAAAERGWHTVDPWKSNEGPEGLLFTCGMGKLSHSRESVLAQRWPESSCSGKANCRIGRWTGSSQLSLRNKKINEWSKSAWRRPLHLFAGIQEPVSSLRCVRPGCGMRSMFVQLPNYKCIQNERKN